MTLAVAIAIFALVSYALRAGGLLLRDDNPLIERYAGALTAGILGSLIVSSSLTAGSDLTIDARLVGLIVATIAALKQLPLAVTLTLAVAATAVTRLVF